jgi:hypothetical protein
MCTPDSSSCASSFYSWPRTGRLFIFRCCALRSRARAEGGLRADWCLVRSNAPSKGGLDNDWQETLLTTLRSLCEFAWVLRRHDTRYADATLNLNNVSIANGVAISDGAGIDNAGTLTVADSVFSGNEAEGPGGGIFNRGVLTVTKSTFSGNVGDGGGGILNDVGATLTVTGSTFTGNISLHGGAGALSNDGTLTVINSTFFGNRCAHSCTAGIFNDGFAKTGSANNGDGVNPLLSASGLANNGGPTQTIAVQLGSPAIDAIPVADCTDQAWPPNPITTDQRGLLRPDAGEQVCDIGAYEFQDFAGETGQANCFDESVRTLTGQFGSLDAAASALGYSSVRALQNAISAFCKG